MWTKIFWLRLIFLFLTPVGLFLANEVCAEEILVKGVPYISQKAHID